MSWSNNRPSYSRDFFRNRARIMRSHPNCSLCQEQPATQVDHIIPAYKGGGDHLGNLAAVCYDCHREKSRKEALEAYRAKSIKRPDRKHFGLK